MAYFFLFFIIISGFLSVFLNVKTVYKKMFYKVVLICIVAFSGLRWKTGTDWDSYFELFEYGGSLNDYLSLWHYEVGYKFINWFFYNYFGNYTVWLIVLSFLIITLKTSIIYKKRYLLLSFFFILTSSLPDLFPTRQQLAIAIIIFAVYQLINNKSLIRYYLLLLIACTIHISSLVALFYPILLKFRLRYVVLSSFLFATFVYLIPHVFPILSLDFFEHQLDVYSQGQGSFLVFSLIQKITVIIFIFYCYISYKDNFDELELSSIKLYFFGTFSFVLISLFNEFFTRFSMSSSSFEYLAISSALFFFVSEKIRNKKYLVALSVLMFFIIFYSIRFYGQFSHYHDLYYPYESIFDNNYKETY